MEVEIIPVIDLLDGNVVYAQGGQRSHYQPIESPLCASSRPADIVNALLELYPFTRLYIADLNAIQNQGHNGPIVREIKASHPQLEVWLDGGFRQESELRSWHEMEIACVLGSESLESLDHFLALKALIQGEIILSLDFNSEGFIGPKELLETPSLWPRSVITMTLAHVGSSLGPDLEKLHKTMHVARNGGKTVSRIYAAGGIRNILDIGSLKAIGVAGALVATALHNGRITAEDIATIHC